MPIRRLIATALIPVALVLAACGDSDDDTAPSTTEAESGAHNDADVEFAQGMIPHHRQAVEMAAMATEAAEDPAIRDLAARIAEAQDPEIEEMNGWLEDWGEEVPSDEAGDDMDMSGADHGMTGEQDMMALEAASGPVFDQLFAELMIEHHQGAVSMAEAEIENGQDAEAIALAEDIVAAQQAEIAELQAFLDGTG